MRGRLETRRSAGDWPVLDDGVEMRVSRTEIWTVRFSRPGGAGLPAPLERRSAPVLIDQRPLPWRRRRIDFSRMALAAGVPICLFGVAAAWWGLQPEPRSPEPARLEIILPPEAPRPAPAQAEPPVPADPPASRTVAAPPALEMGAAPRPPAPVSLDTLPEVQAALRRTIATGAAEPWAAAGLTGFAVTSPIQIDEDRACRNVAIWAEGDGAAGATINRRMCLTEGGAWTLLD